MKDANELFEKYKAGKCTPRELQILHKWFHHLGENEVSDLTEDDLQDAGKLLHANMSALTARPRVRRIWPRVAAVAAMLLLISSVVYFSGNKTQPAETQYTSVPAEAGDIAPGGNIAVLTLSDGRKINLNSATNGELVTQSGITVSKTADGQLVYKVSAPGLVSTPGQLFNYPFPAGPHHNSYAGNMVNTVETPRGGEYQVTLADGTRVWLNAASSLRYPAIFTGGERRVELEGEAYFEVAPNKAMPFRVQSKQQVVEVLGTHFNIASYHDDEAVLTTLVEGRVSVAFNNKLGRRILKPGEQAAVKPGAASIMVRSVDVEEAIAWKNGYFLFNDENIESIMRKVARWYNVDIEYTGQIPSVGFGGTVLKSKNISGVLKTLELTEAVHFKVQGRRVIVMP